MAKKNKAKEILDADRKLVLCYLCRQRPAVTWDHVPPQNIFPIQAQFKGFKLPACNECNNEFSKDDEYFRDVLTMAATNADATEVLQEKTIPSITRPWAQLQRVRKIDRIIETTFPMPIISQSGLQLPTQLAHKFDSERTSRVCERIVRGLYYHIANEPLAEECKVKGALMRRKDVDEIYRGLMDSSDPKWVHAPDDTFLVAMWGLSEDRHMTSVWLMRFYENIYAAVSVTGPAYIAMAYQALQDELADQRRPEDD